MSDNNSYSFSAQHFSIGGITQRRNCAARDFHFAPRINSGGGTHVESLPLSFNFAARIGEVA